MSALLVDGEAVTLLAFVVLDGALPQWVVRGEDGLRRHVHPSRVVVAVEVEA